MNRILSAVLLILLAGCGTGLQIIDTAVMPLGVFAGPDPDLAAMVEANAAFGLTGHLPKTPQATARALADLDYAAGAFNTHVRWYEVEATAKQQMLLARREAREAIGVSPHAPAQAVLDALLAASFSKDEPALLAALSNPIFSLGPEQTLDRLQHLPELPTTPYALAHVNQSRLHDEEFY